MPGDYTLNKHVANQVNPHGLVGWFGFQTKTLLADAASMTITDIPQIFAHLKIFAQWRSDYAAVFENVLVSFNGDTNIANYDMQQLQGSGATASAAENIASVSTNVRALGSSVGNTGLADSFSMNDITIPGPAAPKLKYAQNFSSIWTARTANGLLIRNRLVGWASTAGILSITFTPQLGTVFRAGSKVSAYGLR